MRRSLGKSSSRGKRFSIARLSVRPSSRRGLAPKPGDASLLITHIGVSTPTCERYIPRGIARNKEVVYDISASGVCR